MKKILIATGLYPPESGGPATYSKLLEERLPEHGFEVSVLPFREVRCLPAGVRHAAYFFKVLGARADIIYAQDTVSVGLPAALAAIIARKKFVVRVPGDYAWEQARQRFFVTDELDEFQQKRYDIRIELMRSVQRFVVNSARAVVVPSEYMKRIVSRWTDPARVHRIYTSIKLPPHFELPHERPGGFLVVSFGRRVPWKGFEALERVVAREPMWTLKLFSDLPHAQAMGWLKSADVYVNNSTYEGLSHQLVEAMALGVPVIATRVGGNPELITDGTHGLLVPPKDDEKLHAALKQVHDNPEAAKDRARQALEKTKQFDFNHALAQVAELLKNI